MINIHRNSLEESFLGIENRVGVTKTVSVWDDDSSAIERLRVNKGPIWEDGPIRLEDHMKLAATMMNMENLTDDEG